MCCRATCAARTRPCLHVASVALSVCVMLILSLVPGVTAADVPRCHVDYNRYAGKTTSKGDWAGLTYDLEFSLSLCTGESTNGVMSVRLNQQHLNVTGRNGTVAMAGLGVVHFGLSPATLGAQYFSSELCYSQVNCTPLCEGAMMGFVDSCKVERTIMPIMIVLFWVIPAVICIGFLTSLYVRKRIEEREQALMRLPEGYSRSPRASPMRRPLRTANQRQSPRPSQQASNHENDGANDNNEGSGSSDADRPELAATRAGEATVSSKNASSPAVAADIPAAAPVRVRVPDIASPDNREPTSTVPPINAQGGLLKSFTSLIAATDLVSRDVTTEAGRGEIHTSRNSNHAAGTELDSEAATSPHEMDDLNTLRHTHTRGSSTTTTEEDIHVDAEEQERYALEPHEATVETESSVALHESKTHQKPPQETAAEATSLKAELEAAEEAARIAAAEEAERQRAEQEAAEEAARLKVEQEAAEEAARIAAAEEAERQRAEQEAAEEAARLKVEQEAAEEAARIAAAEEAERQRAEQEAAEEAARIAAAEEAERQRAEQEAAEAQRRLQRDELRFRRRVDSAEKDERAVLVGVLESELRSAADVVARRVVVEEVERIQKELFLLADVEEPASRASLEAEEHAIRRAVKTEEEDDRAAAEAAFEAAEQDLLDATVSYNAEYRERMMTRVQPDYTIPPPRPFIGFSLAEDVKRGILVVDGLYKDGPAYQTGIRIGDVLLRVCGVDVNTIAEARRVVDSRCRCGRVSPFTLVTPMNQQYSVALWIMTADPQHSDKPFFFDVHMHDRLESPRKKHIVESMDILESPAVSLTNTPRAPRSRLETPRAPAELLPSPASAFSVTPIRPTMRAPRSSQRRDSQQPGDGGGSSDSDDGDLKLAATLAGLSEASSPHGYTPRNRVLQS